MVCARYLTLLFLCVVDPELPESCHFHAFPPVPWSIRQGPRHVALHFRRGRVISGARSAEIYVTPIVESSRLCADLTVQCYDSTYVGFIWFGVLATLIYPIGRPVPFTAQLSPSRC